MYSIAELLSLVRLQIIWASLVAQMIKNLPGMQETHSLEKQMSTHSSILAWRIPWSEEPGGVQSVRSHRVGHDSPTEHTHTNGLKFYY